VCVCVCVCVCLFVSVVVYDRLVLVSLTDFAFFLLYALYLSVGTWMTLFRLTEYIQYNIVEELVQVYYIAMIPNLFILSSAGYVL
jgi:hypothetical protein